MLKRTAQRILEAIMAIGNAKQRQSLRKQRREYAVNTVQVSGWAEGKPISTLSTTIRWPFRGVAEAIDKTGYRLRVYTTADAVGGERLLVDKVCGYDGAAVLDPFDAFTQAVSEYTGIGAKLAYGPWYYQMVSPSHLRPAITQELFPRIKLAEAGICIAEGEFGDIAFRVLENEHIDSKLPYHVEWRYLADDTGSVNWSSLEYFIKSIII